MVTNESAKGRIVRKRVASLRPSPENLSLYRPTGDDPDIQRLAESIAKNGLLEPLVVTEDRYIVSGHRRHAAPAPVPATGRPAVRGLRRRTVARAAPRPGPLVLRAGAGPVRGCVCPVRADVDDGRTLTAAPGAGRGGREVITLWRNLRMSVRTHTPPTASCYARAVLNYLAGRGHTVGFSPTGVLIFDGNRLSGTDRAVVHRFEQPLRELVAPRPPQRRPVARVTGPDGGPLALPLALAGPVLARAADSGRESARAFDNADGPGGAPPARRKCLR
jgi:hypothetical protein